MIIIIPRSVYYYLSMYLFNFHFFSVIFSVFFPFFFSSDFCITSFSYHFILNLFLLFSLFYNIFYNLFSFFYCSKYILLQISADDKVPVETLPIRQPFFVKPGLRLLEMLAMFREGRCHLALGVYGAVNNFFL